MRDKKRSSNGRNGQIKFPYIQRVNLRPDDPNYGITQHVDFSEIMAILADDGLKNTTAAIRFYQSLYIDTGDPQAKKAKNKLKADGLPSVLFSAVVPIGSGHSGNNTKAHTHHIVIDLDDVRDPENVRRILAADPLRKFIFASPSGSPKVIFPVDHATVENHKAIFDQVYNYLLKLFTDAGLNVATGKMAPDDDLQLDHSGNNITRNTFLCYDPDAAWYGDHIFHVDVDAIQSAEKAQERATHDLADQYAQCDDKLLESIYNHLDANDKSITAEYDDWIRLAFALIHATDPKTARAYFHKFSSLDASYKASNVDYHFNTCLNSKKPEKTPATLGTILWMAKKHGYTVPLHLRPRKTNTNHIYLPSSLDDVSDANGVHFSDYKAQVMDAIDAHGRLVIQARTGAGKNYGFLHMDADYIGMAHIMHEKYKARVIMVVPTIFLLEQVASKYNIPAVGGKYSTQDHLSAAINAPVCVVTINSMHRVCVYPETEIIIMDECQDFMDGAYRENKKTPHGDLYNHAIDYMMNAKRAIMISATPPPFFDRLDFHYLKIHIPENKNIRIHPMIFNGDKYESILPHLKKEDYTTGIIYFYVNDRNAYKKIMPQIAAMIPDGRRVVEINARKKENPDYKHLADHGHLPDDVCLAIVTKIMEAGINNDDPNTTAVYHITAPSASNYPDPAHAIQFNGRARNVAALDVYSFTHHRDGVKLEKSIMDLVDDEYTAAGLEMAWMEEMEKRRKSPATASTASNLEQKIKDAVFIRRHSKSKALVIDHIAIMRRAHKWCVNALSTDDYYQWMADACDHYSIQPLQYIAADQDDGYRETCQDLRTTQVVADAKINTLLVDDPENTQAAIYHTTDHVGLKRAIIDHVPVNITTMPLDAMEMHKNHKDAFDHTTHAGTHYWHSLMDDDFDTKASQATFKQLSKTYKTKKRTIINDAIQSVEMANEKAEKSLLYWQNEWKKCTEKEADAINDLENKDLRKDQIAARNRTIEKALKRSMQAMAGIKTNMATIEECTTKMERIALEKNRMAAITELVYFDSQIFGEFCSTFHTLDLMHQRSKKETRSMMDVRDLRRTNTWRKYARMITRYKNRQITSIQMARMYAMASGINDPSNAEIESHKEMALIRFKELYDFSQIRDGKKIIYVPLMRQKFATFCHKHGFDANDYRVKKQRLHGNYGAFSQSDGKNTGDHIPPILYINKAG